MATLSNFPYFPIEFTKQGQPYRPAEVDALLQFLQQQPVTDVLVLSHGWNNDMKEANDMYTQLLDFLFQGLNSPSHSSLTSRRFVVVGVLWPSKKFADQELIASGAAGNGSPVTNDVLLAELDRLRGVFDADDAEQKLEEAKKLVPELKDSRNVRRKFAELLLALVPSEASPDLGITAQFKSIDSEEDIVKQLGAPLPTTIQAEFGFGPSSPQATENGGAAGLGEIFQGIKAGALNLLNFTTYYQMKERAGIVGKDGLFPILEKIRETARSIKLHLIGHSFGGRLVTAAANAGAQKKFEVDTLTLLQAAFSHYGFSDKYDGSHAGFFREIITNSTVSGPFLITHSIKDTAVGKMYPLASFIAHQVAAAVGDKHDKYGGIGRNGAQKTPEVTEGQLMTNGVSYSFQAGHIYNLNADTVIQNHGDICRTEVASAILQAIAAT